MAVTRSKRLSRNPVKRLLEHGQSPWLDGLGRGLLSSGDLERMIDEYGLRGIVSSLPAFERAVTQGSEYSADIAALASEGLGAEAIFESLVVADLGRAADALLPVYRATGGADGFVSVDVAAHLADDAGAMIAEVKHLRSVVDRCNLIINVPATGDGLTALRALLSEGISVGVTELFCLKRYRDVLLAYLEGMEAAASARRAVDKLASVAAFCVSPIDVAVDAALERIAEEHPERRERAMRLRGEASSATARLAYAIFEELAASPRFRRLAERGGALPQRLLWRGVAPQQPSAEGLKHVEALIGPYTICAMSRETLEAYGRHGRPATRLVGRTDSAAAVLPEVRRLGVDVDALTAGLQSEALAELARERESLLEILEIARQSARGARVAAKK